MEWSLKGHSGINNSADMVNENDRFKFIDDLSVLEIVNLLTVGTTSFNLISRSQMTFLTNVYLLKSLKKQKN